MRKKIYIILMLFLFFILNIIPSFADNKPEVTVRDINVSEKLDVIYFYSPKCLSCRENINFISELADNTDINLIKYDTDKEDCSGIQAEYAKHYNVSTANAVQIPAIYFGDYYYQLAPSNQKEVSSKINEYISGNLEVVNYKFDANHCSNTNIYEDVADNLTIGGILLAGLIDGINPCAISMLLIFYSFLIFSSEKKKRTFISISFIIGMFIANYSFGMGINTFYNLFAGNIYIMVGMYIISMVMCLIALTLNSIDILNHNKSGEVKNQLSDKVKFKLTNLMRKTVFSKYAIIIALLVGFLIGVVELSCTGQIYLPTLVYMISNSDKTFSFAIMLVLYNLMFVLPLIIITIVASCVQDVEKLKGKILNNNHIIKIVGNIFFIFIFVLLLKDLISTL